jgi:hypothetical protein
MVVDLASCWDRNNDPDTVLDVVIVPAGSMNWREAMMIEDPW